MLAVGGAPGSLRLVAPLALATPRDAARDLTLYGLVYGASVGPSQAIAGATVSVAMCVPRSFHAASGLEGHYELFLPGLYLRQCSEVTQGVSAIGYEGYWHVPPVAELHAQPQRDIGLLPEGAPTPTATIGPPLVQVYLPVVMVSRQRLAWRCPLSRHSSLLSVWNE